LDKLAVPLIAGLIGALVSAALSFFVRLKAKEREDTADRKRVALVHFLRLTQPMAVDFMINDLISKQTKVAGGEPMEGFEMSHATAVLLAEALSTGTPEGIAHATMVLKPFAAGMVQAIDDFEISTTDLSRMPEVSVYTYHRHMTASIYFKTALSYLERLLESGKPELIDAAVLHSLYQSYRGYVESAGLLRAALKVAAGVSDDYSAKTLERAAKAVTADSARTMNHAAQLAKAKASHTEQAPPKAAAENGAQVPANGNA
jgi:hypothetical protein